MNLICDTSGILAAINKQEQHHEQCASTLGSYANLVVSPLVLAELDYLASRHLGSGALQPFYDDIENGIYEVAHINGEIITAARQVDIQYADLKIGLTDAVNVVLANEYHTHKVLTLDSHYRATKPLARYAAFQLLPADS